MIFFSPDELLQRKKNRVLPAGLGYPELQGVEDVHLRFDVLDTGRTEFPKRAGPT